MAITLHFGIVTKRRNSTLVPPPETMSYTMDVVLKQPTSDHNPEFYIKPEQDNTFPYNYCQWGSWYYFIDDIIRERNNLYRLKCSLDVLATYKAEILQTSAFVLYDTAGDSQIVDRRLSTKTTAVTSTSIFQIPPFEVGSCVILGIVGKGTAGMYAVSESEAKALLNTIDTWLDDAIPLPEGGFDAETISDAISDIGNSITYGLRQLISSGKAGDCIKSAIMLPIPASDLPGSGETIYLGEFDTGISGKRLNANAQAVVTTSVSIPWQASDWRRNSPYHQIYLYMPYCGAVSLPASELTDCNALTITCYINSNGGVTYNIFKAGTNYHLGRFSGNCASNYMIGASNISLLSQAQSVISAGVGAAAAALTGGVAGVVAGFAGLNGMISNVQPIPNSIGGGGGGAAFTDGPVGVCTTVFHDTTVSPSSVSSVMGIPAMAAKSLSGLSGFVQTLGASVAITGSASAREQINNMLDSGIFIE